MHGLNFSLRNLLLGVLLVALGLAALQSDSTITAGLTFSFALGMLCLAIVGIVSRRGNARLFWLGFAVFGWIYAFTAFGLGGPQSPLRWQHRPELISSQLLELYSRFRVPYRVGSKVVAQWRGNSYYPGVIRQVKDGQMLVAWDDGDTPLWVYPSQIQGNTENYQRIGHGLFCPLVGWLGGVFALWMFSERKPRANLLPPRVQTVPEGAAPLSETSTPAPG